MSRLKLKQVLAYAAPVALLAIAPAYAYNDQYDYDTGSQGFSRQGPDANGSAHSDLSVQSPLVHTWTSDDATLVNTIGDVPDYVSVWHCDGSNPGKGQSDLWNAFYSAKKENKKAALENAIVGVGDSTAQCMLDNDIFKTKARSWDEFVNRVYQAADVCPGGKSIVNNILGQQNGERNMENLGYSQGELACGWQNYQVGSHSGVVGTHYENVPTKHSENLPGAQEPVSIDVQNAPLLRGESYGLTARFKAGQPVANDLVVSSAPSGLQLQVANQSMSNGAVHYTVQGTRVKVAPSSSSVQVTTRGFDRNGKLAFDAQDLQYDPSTVNMAGNANVKVNVYEMIPGQTPQLLDTMNMVLKDGNAAHGESKINASQIGEHKKSSWGAWFASNKTEKNDVTADYSVTRDGSAFTSASSDAQNLGKFSASLQQ